MNASEFKSVLGSLLVNFGFVAEGGSYYIRSEDVICVIGLQKASFENSYFVNVGYLIRSIHPDIDAPRYMDGDLRARFSFFADGKEVDLFNPKAIHSHHELEKIIRENVDELIAGTFTIDGLKDLIERRPTIRYQTTLKAKAALKL